MSADDTRPILVAWSGGKDCTLALDVLRRSAEWRPVGLLTTVTAEYDRISMHGVRTSLLRRQAEAIGLPLTIVSIPAGATNEVYRERMGEAMLNARSQGIGAVAFGDIFLEDVREYRERMLDSVDMTSVFPLWGRATPEVSEDFIDSGYRAVLTCVDTAQAPAELAGREFDAALLRDLPPEADPCGENGEFHSFVYDGQIFSRPVPFARGEPTLRDERFLYFDLLEADPG